MDDISISTGVTDDNNKSNTSNRSLSDLKAESHSVSPHRMRWFFAITLFIWTLASIVVPSLIFYLTKSPLVLSLFSTLAPPIILWLLFAKYLFPMNERTFEIKKLKIEARQKRTEDKA